MTASNPATPAPRVLVAGLPRSGTTWVGEVLGRSAGAHYLHEPDNHLVRPDAWWAKRRLGPYPELHAGADGGDYDRLWALAFAGGPRPSPLYAGLRILQRAGAPQVSGRLASRHRSRPAAGPLVVKSVHCARALEWAVDRFQPAVVVVERHPFGVISSWRKLGWDDFLDTDRGALRYSATVLGVDPPPAGAPWLERAAWHYGLLSSYLREARRRHPDWLVVRHEVLCAGPEPVFRRLCDRLGLQFTAEAARFLAASNRPGDGYSTHRLWHEQVDGGRSRLAPAERALVLATLEAFDGALAVAEPPCVTTVTEVGSAPSHPLLRS
jgi:hypothetical protein